MTLKEAIIDLLVTDLAYANEDSDCINEIKYGDYLKCPFFKPDEDGNCECNCNSEEYFRLLLDKLMNE